MTDGASLIPKLPIRQRGVSLLAVIVIGAIAGLFAILVMRAVPFYTEYAAIQRALAAVVAEAEAGGPAAVRAAFDRRASADYISSVSGKDLIIEKDAAGRVTVRVSYERVLPLVANVSLLFSFEAKAP